MITRNATAILAAIFLVTISSQANAARSANVDQFCGDRYCGHSVEVKEAHKSNKTKPHKLKIKKPIQIASIGNEPIHEAPVASGGLLAKAKSYMGTNPTGYASLWCARFIAYIAPTAAATLKRMGLNPNMARDYAKLPGAKTFGQVGDLVVLSRGRGGHIGVVAGFKDGNPIVVSGNHGHRVGIGEYSRARVIAYVSI